MNAPAQSPPSHTAGLTVLAMIAFAANSLLCRAALATGDADPFAFSLLRLGSGAVVLFVVHRTTRGPLAGSTAGAAALLVYALAFAVAYLTLPAGAGALILFAAVQLTMLGVGFLRGERLGPRGSLGALLAFGGLVVLLWPADVALDTTGAALMALSGIGWGVYSLLGRGDTTPLATTAGNFLRAAPIALLAWGAAVMTEQARAPSGWTLDGALLAVCSGALASGLGYAIWYRALAHLSTPVAAVSQLSVPIIAAAGGVMLLGEALTLRMVAATVVTLAGIALVIHERSRAPGTA